MQEEQREYTLEIDHIIALCHIIDDFEEFQKRLVPTLSSENYKEFAKQLEVISTKYPQITGAEKAKQFYSENKAIIDTINRYTELSWFIINNCCKPSCEPGRDLQYFYKYIFHHKEKIGQILELLNKLKNLNIHRCVVNESLDFTKKIYSTSPMGPDARIEYVENIQVLPSYEEERIYYKTTNSNYKINLDYCWREIGLMNRVIVLNSLLFDAKSLPNSISMETIIDPLVKEKEAQKEQTKSIRNSVNLSVCVSDLEKQVNEVNDRISKLDGVNKKEELKKALSGIRKHVETLKKLSQEYDATILEQEPLLAPEVLENEKDLYLKRRF